MHRTLSHSLLQQDHHESRRSLQSTASSQSLLQPPESRRSEPPAWKEFLQQRHESGMPGGRRSVTPRSGRAHNLSHVVEADARSPPALASPGSEALLTAVFDRQPVNHEPLPAVPGAVGAHADARRESRDMTGEGGSVATAGSETGPSPNALEQSARVNTKTFQQWVCARLNLPDFSVPHGSHDIATPFRPKIWTPKLPIRRARNQPHTRLTTRRTRGKTSTSPRAASLPAVRACWVTRNSQPT